MGSPNIVAAGADMPRISRFENALRSGRRVTHSQTDGVQGLKSPFVLVARIAVRIATWIKDVAAQLDQEPGGDNQVLL